MQAKPFDSRDRLRHLERRIARLRRRAQQLRGASHKYWTARRVIFVCGGLLALLSCRYSGQTAGWILAASFVVPFCVVALYHGKIRDSITRHVLMLNIKEVQLARTSAWVMRALQSTPIVCVFLCFEYSPASR
jgi:hypothetical protein